VPSSVRYAYLHGFASGPRSAKGLALAERFHARGLELELPDLNRPSFGELRRSAMLAHLDRLHERRGRPTWRLVGSSLGGWLAARWAELHPERVDRLVLLCPAFDMGTRWPTLFGARTMERWRNRGRLHVPDASGRMVPLHYEFFEEGEREPAFPEVPCPTVIVHGVRDETVPVEVSRRYAETRPHVRLVEVDDDHALVESADRIAEVAFELFEV
jgi:hypothetical protein